MFIEMYEKGELGYLEVVATNNKIVQSLVLVPKTLSNNFGEIECSVCMEKATIFNLYKDKDFTDNPLFN